MSRLEKVRDALSKVEPLRLVAALSGVLLATGLLVDLGFTQQRLQDVTRLAVERDRLRAQVFLLDRAAREEQDLARHLGGERLIDALTSQLELDAVSYLGLAAKRAGLTRSELTTEATAEMEGLRRIRCTLRVSGTYAQVTECVRALEQGPRLVAIDALDIAGAPETGRLEARLAVSVYDPILPRSAGAPAASIGATD